MLVILSHNHVMWSANESFFQDLIEQVRRLVGDNITDEAAIFYLEMNQFNVASAVGSYFDLEAGAEAKVTPPQMMFVRDVTIGEGESVPPNTTFVKTWQVRISDLLHKRSSHF